MKNFLIRTSLGLLTLALVTSCSINWKETVVSSPYTQDNLLVEISSLERKYNREDPIWIEFSITNTGDEKVKVNRIQSPLEGKFTQDYFDIRRRNNQVYYTGRRLNKRRAILTPTLTLEPGERVVACVDVSQVYTIDEGGKYQVQFMGSDLNHLPDSEEIEIKVK
ncbi:MAG: hypothetical protein AAF789_15005 [Bacteroidota bacterium]